jgi:hypothetical protein
MWNRRLLTRKRMMTILRDLAKLNEDPQHPAGKVRGQVVVRCLRAHAQRGKPRYDGNNLQPGNPYRQ